MIELHVVSRQRASILAVRQRDVCTDADKTRLYVDDWEPSDYEIRKRAYEISRTGPGGRPDPQADWLQAKTELLGRRFLGLS